MPCIRLFGHLYVEVSSIWNIKLKYQISSIWTYKPFRQKKWGKLETCHQMGDILYTILILIKAVLKEI